MLSDRTQSLLTTQTAGSAAIPSARGETRRHDFPGLFWVTLCLGLLVTALHPRVARAFECYGGEIILPKKRHEPHGLQGGSGFLEEDEFNLFRPTDRNYTGGGAISLSGRVFEPLTLPVSLLDCVWQPWRIFKYVDSNSTVVFRSYELTFGLTVFTPKDLRPSLPPVPPDAPDRPYAALPFITISHSSASERVGRGFALTTELTLAGIGGLNAGYYFQSGIHRLLRGHEQQCGPGNVDNPPQPCGWANQISNGGEPTGRYGVRMQHLIFSEDFWRVLSFDLKTVQEGEIGYYTDASTGAGLRIGLIDSPFWGYSTSPLRSVNQVATSNARAVGWRQAWCHPELYLWGGLSAKAILYNALLEGQFRDSKVTLGWGEINHFVAEYEAGATASWWIFSGTWAAFMGRTAEFGGPQERSHLWTSFFFSIRRQS